jgi:adenylate cyclase
MLAGAHVLEGDRASALARFEEALAEVERHGERFHEAPLLIGKSHLLAAGAEHGRSSRAAASAAEECLRRALDIARVQGARLIELRAAVALARHCRARGRAEEAREPLRAAYDWFAARALEAREVDAARRLLAALEP